MILRATILPLLLAATVAAQSTTPNSGMPSPAAPPQQNSTPANTPQTQSAPALPPCEVPKPPSILGRLKQKAKQHIEGTAVAQANKEDRKISTKTNGGVDPGLGDSTATAANAADQPKPCTPANKTSAK